MTPSKFELKGKTMNRSMLAALGLMLGFVAFPADEAAAKACGHTWAVPGTYTMSGKFRGKVEAAGAHLSRDCRVKIRVPGVFSGTKVRKAGKCLRFNFKIEGVKKAFSARWCNTVGYIPWNGKNIRASVKLVKRQANVGGGGSKKKNFN